MAKSKFEKFSFWAENIGVIDMPAADGINLVLAIITAITGLASIILGIKGYRLQQENDNNEKELVTFRWKLDKFKKDTASYTWPDNPLLVDVIVLGPKQSGKSSITQLWKRPWTDINLISTTTKWDEYLVTIDEIKKIKQETHPKFEVECDFSSVLKLRIRDYAGEDRFRTIAIQELEKLHSKAVVLLVMKVGYSNEKVSFSDDNSAYFSSAFVEIIHENLKHIAGSLTKVIVVFNKIDALPPTWDAQKMMNELKSTNSNSIHQIERVFSPLVEYKLTSALTNYGLIDLLGTVATTLVGEDIEKTTLEQIAERLKKR